LAENADKFSIRPSRIGWIQENQSVTPPARIFRSVNQKNALT